MTSAGYPACGHGTTQHSSQRDQPPIFDRPLLWTTRERCPDDVPPSAQRDGEHRGANPRGPARCQISRPWRLGPTRTGGCETVVAEVGFDKGLGDYAAMQTDRARLSDARSRKARAEGARITDLDTGHGRRRLGVARNAANVRQAVLERNDVVAAAVVDRLGGAAGARDLQLSCVTAPRTRERAKCR